MLSSFFLFPFLSSLPLLLSSSHLPPRKPVLRAESVTCLHTHFISFRGYLELLPPLLPLPPPPCQEARGRQKAASHGRKTGMSGCSWTAIIVALGDRVQGKLRTLLIRTQDNPKPHSPAQSCVLSPLPSSGGAGRLV